MSSVITDDSLHASCRPLSSSDQRPDCVADAARYAVLQRIAPVLRHDMAGLMQPISMQMIVLQRRLQMPAPDLQAIAKNLASASVLTKEATAGCMNALGWIAFPENTAVSLFSSVNQAAALLAIELSAQALEISNIVPDDGVTVPQSFFRTVLIGALLAFCDQRSDGDILQISVETEEGNMTAVKRLVLRMLPDEEPKAPRLTESLAMDRPSRRIHWVDVEAMAGSFAVTVARGNGWLASGVPNCD